MYCFARGLSFGIVRANEFSVKVCNFYYQEIEKTGIVFCYFCKVDYGHSFIVEDGLLHIHTCSYICLEVSVIK